MRWLMVATALLAWGGTALAQSPTPDDLDRLKRMLDERIPQAPRTRGLGKGDRPLKSDDFQSIRRRDRDGSGTPGADPGKRSQWQAPALIGIAAAEAGDEAGGAALPPAAAPRGSQRVQARRDSYV